MGMETSVVPAALRTASTRTPFVVDDGLRYLPVRPLQEFRKKRIVYDAEHPADRLYLVIQGRVKIVNTLDDGSQVVARFVSRDGLFGEGFLIGGVRPTERAIAFDNIAVMSWCAADVDLQMEREPRLGIALLQYFTQTSFEL